MDAAKTDLLSDSMRRIRGAGGTAKERLAAWCQACDGDAFLAHYGKGSESNRLARIRLNRAWLQLRHSGPGNYRIDRRRRDDLRYRIQRGVALEHRGHQPGSMVWRGRAARVARHSGLYVDDLPDLDCYSRLKHFMVLRDLTQYEAIEILRRLADRYHYEVQALVQVRYASRPFFFGLPTDFLLRTRDNGTVRRKGAGVWIDKIWRSGNDGSRMVRVVFAHSRGKRRYTVDLPIDFDVESVNLIPDPPAPLPALPSCHFKVAAELEAAGEDVTEGGIDLFLMRATIQFQREHPGKFLSEADQHAGLGRAYPYEWVRDRGRWVKRRRIGSWLSAFQPEIGAVEVTVERPDDRTCKLICSARSLMIGGGAEMVVHPAETLEPDRAIPGVFRLRDDRGAVSKAIVVDGGGPKARWVVGTSVLDALGRAKTLRENAAAAA